MLYVKSNRDKKFGKNFDKQIDICRDFPCYHHSHLQLLVLQSVKQNQANSIVPEIAGDGYMSK